MKFVVRISLLLCMLALSLGIGSAQSAQDQSAQSYLMDYINSINTGDYATAYRMMVNRNDTYEQFVAGYEHTVRIVPYFGFMGAAAGSTYMTTILLGYQDDGSVETYYGYFQLHSGQLYSPIRNNGGWVLSRGQFRLLSDTTVLSNASMDALLETAWDETVNVSSQLIGLGEVNSEFSMALMNYYDLVNTGDYGFAYNSWVRYDYLAPYADYVAGYSDTKYVTVYTGNHSYLPNSSYLYLPTVLVSEHTDGSFESYTGCYVLGRFAGGNLGLVNGRFSLAMDDVMSSDEIFDTLATINCASLNIGF